MHYLNDYLQVQRKWRKQQKSCRRFAQGCLLIFIIILLILSALGGWFVAQAEAPAETAVYLLIDNSDSMFPVDMPGSDPFLLRLAAARLLIKYLGTGFGEQHFSLSTIFFGSEAVTVFPLTPLATDSQREALFEHIAAPEPMGWTDPVAALQLVLDEIAQQPGGPAAIILLTDGRPELDGVSDSDLADVYSAQLIDVADQIAAADIPFFLILLNGNEQQDKALQDIWLPFWHALYDDQPEGSLYQIRSAEALFPTYLDIARQLTAAHSDGVVVQAEARAEGVRHEIQVEPNLAQLALIVRKSTPEIAVQIYLPDGNPLSQLSPGLLFRSQVDGQQEIWTILSPPAGSWQVELTGAGLVTVWKDYEVATNNLPAPTARPLPVVTTSEIIQPTKEFAPTVMLIPPGRRQPVATVQPRLAQNPNQVMAPRAADSTLGYWMGAFGLTTLTAVIGLGWRWRQQRVHVGGSLRILQAPMTNQSPSLLRLDALGRPKLRIGLPPADIPLPGTTEFIEIVAAQGPQQWPIYHLQGSERVFLNSRPLKERQLLSDSAIISFGSMQEPTYRLRYENLQLRLIEKMFSLWGDTRSSG